MSEHLHLFNDCGDCECGETLVEFAHKNVITSLESQLAAEKEANARMRAILEAVSNCDKDHFRYCEWCGTAVDTALLVMSRAGKGFVAIEKVNVLAEEMDELAAEAARDIHADSGEHYKICAEQLRKLTNEAKGEK